MDTGPRIDSYEWAGGREAMLRWGPADGPVAVLALPLFEEANRTRAFAASICRALAGLGVGSILPDLPGQGESLTSNGTCPSILHIADGIDQATQREWQAGQPLYGAAIRSGALLDKLGLLNGRWHFAPQAGPALMRELKRIKQATSPAPLPKGEYWYLSINADEDDPIDIGGNLISPGLLTDLTLYEPWTSEDGGHVRTVRLTSDSGPADRKVAGRPLWRAAEPDNDPALAQLLARDIAEWIARCEG